MSFLEHLRSAWQTIVANKLRTFLTTLGILIGIVSVTVMLSLGDSMQQQVLTEFEGTANILRISVAWRGERNQPAPIRLKDARAIQKQVKGLDLIVPYLSQHQQINSGKQNVSVNVFSSEPTYAKLKELEIEKGRWLSFQDEKRASEIIVLGNKTASDLFKKTDPLGQFVQMNKKVFTVVGVLKSDGKAQWKSSDNQAFVPLSTTQNKINGNDTVNTIEIKVTDVKNMIQAKRDIAYALMKSRRIGDLKKIDFNVSSDADFLKSFEKVSLAINAFLGGIGVIALIVGGIGVMNIMVVSVTERTREIGIRKAIGGQDRDILIQFLIESVLLCLLGAVLGILISYGIIFVASKLIIHFVPDENIVIILSTRALLTSIAAAIFVGLFFGIFPARKAAALRPIDALRYE